MEFLYEYGLFVAKAVTLVIAFVVVVSTIVGVASKQKQGRAKKNKHLLIFVDRLGRCNMLNY